jgi:hypothetical protein
VSGNSEDDFLESPVCPYSHSADESEKSTVSIASPCKLLPLELVAEEFILIVVTAEVSCCHKMHNQFMAVALHPSYPSHPSLSSMRLSLCVI